jgi:hypothetical protein
MNEKSLIEAIEAEIKINPEIAERTYYVSEPKAAPKEMTVTEILGRAKILGDRALDFRQCYRIRTLDRDAHDRDDNGKMTLGYQVGEPILELMVYDHSIFVSGHISIWPELIGIRRMIGPQKYFESNIRDDLRTARKVAGLIK